MIWYFACDNFMDKTIVTELIAIPVSDKFQDSVDADKDD
jgi:hypothetical protein